MCPCLYRSYDPGVSQVKYRLLNYYVTFIFVIFVSAQYQKPRLSSQWFFFSFSNSPRKSNINSHIKFQFHTSRSSSSLRAAEKAVSNVIRPARIIFSIALIANILQRERVEKTKVKTMSSQHSPLLQLQRKIKNAYKRI